MVNHPFRATGAIDPLRSFRRALTVRSMAHVLDRDVHSVAVKLYGREEADAIVRAASASMDTATATGLAGVRIGPFLRSLRPKSAAAQLFDLAPLGSMDLDGASSIALPGSSSELNAAWVGEGNAAPVFRGSLNSVTLAPRKVVALAGLTNELADHSAGAAEQVITDLLEDAVAKALDTKLFSADAAAAGVSPAGLLQGVTPLAGASGGGQGAVVNDLKALAATIVQAGGGANLVIIAAVPQAVTLQVLAPNINLPVIAAPHLAAGTVIMLDANAFAAAFRGGPQVDVSENAVVHFEDANPAHIGTAGSPNTVAAPARSAFQADMKVLRAILRGAWAMRAPAIAFTTMATW